MQELGLCGGRPQTGATAEGQGPREPTREERSGRAGRQSNVKGHHNAGTQSPNKTATIAGKLRRAGVTATTGKEGLPRTNPKEKAQAWSTGYRHRAGVCRPGAGKIKMESVGPQHSPEFQPTQPPRRSAGLQEILLVWQPNKMCLPKRADFWQNQQYANFTYIITFSNPNFCLSVCLYVCPSVRLSV